ncbi:MAG: hypothetical protein EXR83_03585 [Gammaproteobacteria bacterium]|nr:hypothetical protein [Gammaproteobacteria bacterium]
MVPRLAWLGGLALAAAALSTAALECPLGPGAAQTVAARYGGAVSFEVWRNERHVGHHRVTFAETDNFLRVSSQLDLRVKILSVEVYRYRYESTEYWCNNQLQRLVAQVNDADNITQVRGEAHDGRLQVGQPPERTSAVLGTFATTHWHAGVLATTTVLNSLTGRFNQVRITPCTARPLGRHSPADTRCYDYTGDLQARVWYGQDGRWQGLAFKGRDGSRIDYRVPAPPGGHSIGTTSNP